MGNEHAYVWGSLIVSCLQMLFIVFLDTWVFFFISKFKSLKRKYVSVLNVWYHISLGVLSFNQQVHLFLYFREIFLYNTGEQTFFP